MFHRLVLLGKIKFLKNEYGLIFDDALLQKTVSINAARNCFLHRDGLVSTQDTRDGDQLKIEWSALVFLAH